jgi:hypothetical protein
MRAEVEYFGATRPCISEYSVIDASGGQILSRRLRLAELLALIWIAADGATRTLGPQPVSLTPDGCQPLPDISQCKGAARRCTEANENGANTSGEMSVPRL